jgi:hypothetical protein
VGDRMEHQPRHVGRRPGDGEEETRCEPAPHAESNPHQGPRLGLAENRSYA